MGMIIFLFYVWFVELFLVVYICIYICIFEIYMKLMLFIFGLYVLIINYYGFDDYYGGYLF